VVVVVVMSGGGGSGGGDGGGGGGRGGGGSVMVVSPHVSLVYIFYLLPHLVRARHDSEHRYRRLGRVGPPLISVVRCPSGCDLLGFGNAHGELHRGAQGGALRSFCKHDKVAVMEDKLEKRP
jgi:hypothetical protein